MSGLGSSPAAGCQKPAYHGSDFDGIPAGPAGLEDASKLPALIAALRARGHGTAELEKILGGNVLRVLAADAPAPAVGPSAAARR